MELHWPTITARLRGRRIADLHYDSILGQLLIHLDGLTLYVSADPGGCQIICDPTRSPAPKPIHRVTPRAGRGANAPLGVDGADLEENGRVGQRRQRIMAPQGAET